ncbi:MAG TPA: hypothetical protein VNT60_07610 [Deinococcales bacterium]|nr:hypothetical protein [Deinococcales bacterium]
MNGRLISVLVVVVLAIILAVVLVNNPAISVLTIRGLAALTLLPLVLGWVIGYMMGSRRNTAPRQRSTATPNP